MSQDSPRFPVMAPRASSSELLPLFLPVARSLAQSHRSIRQDSPGGAIPLLRSKPWQATPRPAAGCCPTRQRGKQDIVILAPQIQPKPASPALDLEIQLSHADSLLRIDSPNQDSR